LIIDQIKVNNKTMKQKIRTKCFYLQLINYIYTYLITEYLKLKYNINYLMELQLILQQLIKIPNKWKLIYNKEEIIESTTIGYSYIAIGYKMNNN